jgi:DNA repair ATPase RecN
MSARIISFRPPIGLRTRPVIEIACFISQPPEYLWSDMDLLFPSESDETITSRVEKMDALLQNIQQVLADIRASLNRTQTLELRVEELEKTVGRLQSVSMDLRNTGSNSAMGSDRIAPLESMVSKLCSMTAEQKAALDQLVEAQQRSIQQLRKEIHERGESEGPAIHEIDDLFCGR